MTETRRFSHFVRQSHRWISLAFTLVVAAAFAFGAANPWLYYLPLLPLLLLFLSGTYMFILPYVARRRDNRA
nr:hypothetical protein [uncultured Devosia sp.]